MSYNFSSSSSSSSYSFSPAVENSDNTPITLVDTSPSYRPPISTVSSPLQSSDASLIDNREEPIYRGTAIDIHQPTVSRAYWLAEDEDDFESAMEGRKGKELTLSKIQQLKTNEESNNSFNNNNEFPFPLSPAPEYLDSSFSFLSSSPLPALLAAFTESCSTFSSPIVTQPHSNRPTIKGSFYTPHHQHITFYVNVFASPSSTPSQPQQLVEVQRRCGDHAAFHSFYLHLLSHLTRTQHVLSSLSPESLESLSQPNSPALMMEHDMFDPLAPPEEDSDELDSIVSSMMISHLKPRISTPPHTSIARESLIYLVKKHSNTSAENKKEEEVRELVSIIESSFASHDFEQHRLAVLLLNSVLTLPNPIPLLSSRLITLLPSLFQSLQKCSDGDYKSIHYLRVLTALLVTLADIAVVLPLLKQAEYVNVLRDVRGKETVNDEEVKNNVERIWNKIQ